MQTDFDRQTLKFIWKLKCLGIDKTIYKEEQS